MPPLPKIPEAAHTGSSRHRRSKLESKSMAALRARDCGTRSFPATVQPRILDRCHAASLRPHMVPARHCVPLVWIPLPSSERPLNCALVDYPVCQGYNRTPCVLGASGSIVAHLLARWHNGPSLAYALVSSPLGSYAGPSNAQVPDCVEFPVHLGKCRWRGAVTHDRRIAEPLPVPRKYGVRGDMKEASAWSFFLGRRGHYIGESWTPSDLLPFDKRPPGRY